MATRLEIAELYVATFNRAADADGLAYWISDGTANTTGLTSLEDISAAMIDNAEYTTLYGSAATDEEFVIALYANVLNRTVDGTDAGVAYWVADLAAGNVTTPYMVTAIINGAKAATGSATDKATIENKATAGLYYADGGLNDVAEATTIMSSVTSDTATVTTAQTTIDAAIVVAAQANATQLTTSTDSLVGTASADVYNAANGTLATADTILDSTTGDADILYAEVTSATSAPRLQNIETVTMTGKYTTVGLDLASSSGIDTLNVNTTIANGTATVTNAASLNAATVALGANIATATITATASGTRDTVMIDGGSAKTVTINGNAGTDTFDATITDAASVTLGLNGGTANIDAYTLHTTGGTMTLNGTSAAKTLTLDNTTAALTVTLTDNQTLVGTGATSKWDITGDSNVTLVVADDGVATAISDLEGIALTNSGAASVNVNIKDTASTTVANLTEFVATEAKFSVDGTASILANVNEGTVVNLAADATAGGVSTLGVGTAANGAYTAHEGTLLVNVSDNQTTNALTTAASVGTLLLTATADEVTDTDANENGTEETHLTIAALDTVANEAGAGTAGQTGTNTVVVQGSEDLEITLWTNGNTNNVGSVDVLVASTMTGALTIGDTAAASTISLGSGNDTVSDTIDAAITTVYGNGGNDTITTGTGADKIYGGAGDDTIVGGATGVNTIDGGTGDDTITSTAIDLITLGAGSDTVIAAAELNYVVSDISATEDTLVITGAATTAVDLTNVTPTTGSYKVSNTGGTADFTLTGSTTADISGFVQLGKSGAAYTLANTTTNTAGAKDDHVAVASTTDATVTTGTGSDTVELATGAASAVTVTDFVTGTDKVIITGTAASAALDLTAVTPASGVYTLDTNAVVTLTGHAETDLTTMVQLGTSTAAYVGLGTGSTTTGGTFDDFISGGAAVDAINFIDNGGMDTILAFKTAGADTLSFDALTGIGATGTTVAANAAKLTDAVDGSVYAFDDASDGTGSEAISTFTVDTDGNTADTILADVASFLDAALGTTTGESYVAVINNTGGTQAYAYTVAGDTAGITADDITLIGSIATTGAIVAADIA